MSRPPRSSSRPSDLTCEEEDSAPWTWTKVQPAPAPCRPQPSLWTARFCSLASGTSPASHTRASAPRPTLPSTSDNCPCSQAPTGRPTQELSWQHQRCRPSWQRQSSLLRRAQAKLRLACLTRWQSAAVVDATDQWCLPGSCAAGSARPSRTPLHHQTLNSPSRRSSAAAVAGRLARDERSSVTTGNLSPTSPA